MHISLPQKRNGMYLFSHKDFDSAAEQLLQEHAPYMFEKAQSLAIENLADEAYSLMIMDRYLSASGSSRVCNEELAAKSWTGETDSNRFGSYQPRGNWVPSRFTNSSAPKRARDRLLMQNSSATPERRLR